MSRREQAVLIPAYQPGAELAELIGKLVDRGFLSIIIVDDGSGPAYEPVFAECRRFAQVRTLRHGKNRGKGAALKTGLSHVLNSIPGCTGVVTADADGQHLPEDIAGVADTLALRPDCLILGVRRFEGRVPARSRIGNRITRAAVRLLMGVELTDTQTGLRGIPRDLIPRLLEIASNGYEFELEMLSVSKHHGWPVAEQHIETVYIENNRKSHFNPLRDSMRIYFVLLRFCMLSLSTALVDNVVFYFAYGWIGKVAYAQVMSRTASVIYNYGFARKAVFLSHERHQVLLPKYLLLVASYGVVSYGLIQLLCASFPLSVMAAKIIAETFLFAASFVMQRDFVFTRRHEPGSAQAAVDAE